MYTLLFTHCYYSHVPTIHVLAQQLRIAQSLKHVLNLKQVTFQLYWPCLAVEDLLDLLSVHVIFVLNRHSKIQNWVPNEFFSTIIQIIVNWCMSGTTVLVSVIPLELYRCHVHHVQTVQKSVILWSMATCCLISLLCRERWTVGYHIEKCAYQQELLPFRKIKKQPIIAHTHTPVYITNLNSLLSIVVFNSVLLILYTCRQKVQQQNQPTFKLHG